MSNLNNKRFDRNDSYDRGPRNFDDRRNFNQPPRRDDRQRDYRDNRNDSYHNNNRDNRDNNRDRREKPLNYSNLKEETTHVIVRERQYSQDEQYSREEIRSSISVETSTKKSNKRESPEDDIDLTTTKKARHAIQYSDDEQEYSQESKLSQHLNEMEEDQNKSNSSNSINLSSPSFLSPQESNKRTPEEEPEEGAYIEERRSYTPDRRGETHADDIDIHDMGSNNKKSRWEEDDDHSDDHNEQIVLNSSSSVKRSNQPIFFDSEDLNAEQENKESLLKKEQELIKIKDDEKETPKPEVVVKKPAPFVPTNVNGCLACRDVANFERVASIGQGAFGVVFKAKEKATGDMVALKKVKMQKEKEGFPLTSVREIRILMQCKHINIVTMKEVVVGTSVDSIFIVMEYVEHDLKGLLEDMNKNFTVSEVKCLLNQLLMGMEYLHDNWILHRDIKTSNLLLNNHGILKIADFGLARPYGSPIRPYTHVVVTLWYRAPELLLGTPTYTPAIDIWAVGCVFAEMITRDPIFKEKNEADQVDKIFKVLGSPDNRNWPGFAVLPHAKNFNFTKKAPNNLRKQFSEDRLSASGLDLMNRLLGYCPEKRITAREALEHTYWEEMPAMKDPDLMPTWPSRTDGRKGRKDQSPEQISDEKKEIERMGFMGTRDKQYSLPANTTAATSSFFK
jgi:cell division cycle 2-like protein